MVQVRLMADPTLRQRFKDEGFDVMSAEDMSSVLFKADDIAERLAAWDLSFTWKYWLTILAAYVFVFGITGVRYGYTMGRFFGASLAVAFLVALIQLSIRWITLWRVRKIFVDVFSTGYMPDKDQVCRVRSVSRWFKTVGRLVLDDGRTIVVVYAPALKNALFLIDTYRK